MHGTGPIGHWQLYMGPVPKVSQRHTWDLMFLIEKRNSKKSHRSPKSLLGTGTIGLSEPYMGPHVSN